MQVNRAKRNPSKTPISVKMNTIGPGYHASHAIGWDGGMRTVCGWTRVLTSKVLGSTFDKEPQYCQ